MNKDTNKEHIPLRYHAEYIERQSQKIAELARGVVQLIENGAADVEGPKTTLLDECDMLSMFIDTFIQDVTCHACQRHQSVSR